MIYNCDLFSQFWNAKSMWISTFAPLKHKIAFKIFCINYFFDTSSSLTMLWALTQVGVWSNSFGRLIMDLTWSDCLPLIVQYYNDITFCFTDTSFYLMWLSLFAREEATTMRWRTYLTSTTSRSQTTPPLTERAKRSVSWKFTSIHMNKHAALAYWYLCTLDCIGYCVSISVYLTFWLV